MPTPKLTTEILNAAILGMETQKDKLDAQIAELRAMLPGGPAATAATAELPARKRKKFSAATRKRMKEAQRLRWARIRGESEPSAPAKAPKAKRRISAEGMKRIIAATKKRWAAARAAKAQPEKAARKKPAVKKAAVKAAPAKAAKKGARKKSVAKKTAPAAAPSVTETGSR
ncbi:MAG: hypothetical protein ACLQU1_42600 [Bryobacteraceae bacterium]